MKLGPSLRSATLLCIALASAPGPVGIASAPIDTQEKPVAQAHAEDYQISFERTETAIRVLMDGELFTSLNYGNVQKPFLYPVIGPAGVRVTRGYPMEQRAGESADHRHHTSLWFAHGDVNGHDFWHGGHGERIVHVESRLPENVPSEIRSVLEWRDPDGDAVCTEARGIHFQGNSTVRTIDINATLIATDGDVTFGDTKEGMFAIRLAPTLRLKGEVAQGSARNSAGVTGADVWGKRAKWIEYSGPINDRRIGIAIFDHPENPRHPTWWHAREYGLVAANPFGRQAFEGRAAARGTLVLKQGESIRFRYRVVIYEGPWDAERLEKAYQDWAAACQADC